MTPPVTYGGAVFLADFMLVFFFGVLTEADFLVVVFVRAIYFDYNLEIVLSLNYQDKDMTDYWIASP